LKLKSTYTRTYPVIIFIISVSSQFSQYSCNRVWAKQGSGWGFCGNCKGTNYNFHENQYFAFFMIFMISLRTWTNVLRTSFLKILQFQSILIIKTWKKLFFNILGERSGEANRLENVQEENASFSGTDQKISLAGHHQRIGEKKREQRIKEIEGLIFSFKCLFLPRKIPTYIVKALEIKGLIFSFKCLFLPRKTVCKEFKKSEIQFLVSFQMFVWPRKIPLL